MRSSAPREDVDLHGFISEFQASVTVPVVVGAKHEAIYKHHGLMMVSPYIVVDNPISLCSGREIYGYPKSLGRFVFDRDAEQPDGTYPPVDWRERRLTVNVFGGPDDPTKRAAWTPFIELTPPEERAGHEEGWSRAKDVVAHFLPKQSTRGCAHHRGRPPGCSFVASAHSAFKHALRIPEAVPVA